MYAKMEKHKEDRNIAISNSVNKKKSGVRQGFGFMSSRAENSLQRKLQKMTNDSSRVSKTIVFQEKATINTPSTSVENLTVQAKPPRDLNWTQSFNRRLANNRSSITGVTAQEEANLNQYAIANAFTGHGYHVGKANENISWESAANLGQLFEETMYVGDEGTGIWEQGPGLYIGIGGTVE